ncbi:Mediator of RNA polymerase II transcription subunit 7 [Umbelopsis sp. WA50703]
MTEQAKAGSAWPEPPTFYRRYTTENLEQAKLVKHGKADASDVRLDFTIELLEPPPPLEGSYVVFDQQWQTEDKLLSLEEMNVKQLYPTGKIDRVFELKKLLRSLMAQFLSLLDILVREPDKFGGRIEDISNILINIHHILNEYRPHQARETLRLMMETQLKKKLLATTELKRRRDEAKGILQALQSEVRVANEPDNVQDANGDVAMDEASPATENVLTELHQASYMSSKLLELVDFIQ